MTADTLADIWRTNSLSDDDNWVNPNDDGWLALWRG